jgi:hypothetical protein
MSSTQQLLLGEGAGGAAPNYIEEVFSTYLYAGNSSTQTITNGIDLSTKGGLVWIKRRNGTARDHYLNDTIQGADNFLISNKTDATQTVAPSVLTAFNTNGFNLNSNDIANGTGFNYVSWSFREQPKFFDVVTWTGNGANRTIAHNLGSVPGSIIVKRTNAVGDWQVYHRSLANTEYLVLNTTAAKATGATRWNSTTPTSTEFSLGTDATVNASGGAYVAYIFAHDAGGFGLTGTDNVISCGSFTNDGSGFATVNLGYEPQWVLTKRINGTSPWAIGDTMRGLTATGADEAHLYANTSGAEVYGDVMDLTSTGFYAKYGGASAQYIYIAIRRGPMKVPTSGTSVFTPVTTTGTGAATSITGVGFPPDFVGIKNRGGVASSNWFDKLRGPQLVIVPNSTIAESTSTDKLSSFDQNGFSFNGGNGAVNGSGVTYINYCLRRAPSFFDEVCYTGTSSARTITHNLTVAPQLLFVKSRSNVQAWSALCTLNSGLQGNLNTSDALGTPSAAVWGNGSVYVAPTASVFTVGTDNETNASTWTYVAYLFATCAGVSKVGSYTGTATTKQIDCGFTGGARFVLIKRTDSTGDWYVWDTARGIVSGNDPYLLLNSTAAEDTSTDYIDTYSAGFEISSTAPAAINASGGTFIFLAIA